MASTNKTTHYELSQFLGTDKPAWLTDYNTDMSKIDAGINTAQSTATGADGKADTVSTNLGNIENLTTSTKTSAVSAINEVDGHADTAQETANEAVGKANVNTTAITNITKELNWNTFANLTFTGSVNPTTQDVKIAMTESKNQFKVYGQLTLSGSSAAGGTDITVTSGDTGLRPEEAINITGTTIKRRDITAGSGTFNELDPWTYTLGTDGRISVVIPRGTNNNYTSITFIACVTILKQFGD